MIKTFTKNLTLLCIALLFSGMQHVNAQCNASFNFTYNANGNVFFQSTSTPTISTGHYWTFGNTQTANTKTASITYTANGTYTVCLSIWTPSASPTCSANICQTINITNAITPTCVLNASFTQTVSAPNATFVSNSTGTVVGSTYTWYYGDSNTGSGQSTTHSYSPGFYTCKLVVNNGSGCIDSAQSFVNIPAPCTLSANFASTQNANGNVTFTSTSTGTVAGTTYTWKKNNVIFASNNPASGNFTNGTYTITLIANNNYSPTPCTSTVSQVITVTSNTCNLTSSFSFTQGTNGLFNFASTTTGTTANTVYFWDFGDGFNITGGPTQSHTYTNGGPHAVWMTAYESNAPSCADSVVNYINVTTVPCVANSNFTLTQNFPLNWTATPAYPWNVSWALWSWGDNTTTFAPQVITSHTYSQTALYTICLTVSVTCAGTSSTCATYSINKTSSSIAMAYVNVVLPTPVNLSTGIQQQKLVSTTDLFVYPNPASGRFEVGLIGLNEEKATIKIYDITGTLIYEAAGTIENGNLNHSINLDKPEGIYFVKVESASGIITKKIILKD
jgi:PKD repeat protein